MTICEKCGTAREKIDDECPSCHFKPRTPEELARAAVLTTKFEAGDKGYGTSQPDLDRIAGDIKEGRPPTISPSRLARHQRLVTGFLATTGWDVASMLAKFFAPALLFIAGLLVVALLLRSCNTKRKHRMGGGNRTHNLVMGQTTTVGANASD